MIAGVADLLQLRQLKDSVVRARPELAHLTNESDSRMLTIDLPPRRSDPRPRVVIGKTRAKRVLVWAVVGSAEGAGLVTTAWPTSLEIEELRDATLAIYDACADGRMPASPWCWNQPVAAPIVRLADALTEAGIEVEAVVSANRLVEDLDEIGPDEAYKWIPLAIGDALRIATVWGAATLANRDGLGWVLDTSDDDNAWRMQLGELANGSAADAPGFPTEDTGLLVGALKRIVDSGERPWNPLKFSVNPFALAHDESDGMAARWLQAMGFRTVTAPEYEGESWGGPFHVVTAAKYWSLSSLKAAFADATVAGRRLVVFSERGFTGPAEKWAGAASVPLFSWPPSHDHISPRSAAAHVLMPQVL